MPTILKVSMFIPILFVCLAEIVADSVGPEFSSIRAVGLETAASNSSNTSNTCHFEISDSSLKDVVRLMRDSKTNVIKLNIWTEQSGNDTANNNHTTLLTDFQWANEVGRTLYSLILQPNAPQSVILSILTVTLSAGINNVDIVLYAENERCLLPENDKSVNLAFYLLLKQLYRATDDNTDYQLCRTNGLTLECCAMETFRLGKAGTKHVPLCSDYSSIVTDSILILLVLSCLFIYFAFPFILHSTNRFKGKREHYKISDSPMGLSFLMHMVFIEEHGPVQSFARKLLVASFVIVILLPVRNLGNFWDVAYLYVLICPWTLAFLVLPRQDFNEGRVDFRVPFFCSTLHFKNLIELIVFPFNLTFWWNTLSELVTPPYPVQSTISVQNESEENPTTSERTPLRRATNDLRESYESVRSVQQPESDDFISRLKRSILQFIKPLILVIVYLVFVFPLSCLYVCVVITWVSYFINLYRICKKCERSSRSVLKLIFVCLLSLWESTILRIFLIIYCSIYFSYFVLHFAIGLFLNGATYGPYLVPLSTILLYSLINWKLSVEAKYTLLITAIYEVCNECSQSSPNNDEPNSDNINNTSDLLYTLQLDSKGEQEIPRKLYKLVRKEFLPYDQVLFHYFTGVLILIAFAYFLYVLMSLSQTSGIPNSVQVLGSIAATMLPIIFNLVWKQNSVEQKQANNIAIKSKLKGVLEVRSHSANRNEIYVVFIKKPESSQSSRDGTGEANSL